MCLVPDVKVGSGIPTDQSDRQTHLLKGLKGIKSSFVQPNVEPSHFGNASHRLLTLTYYQYAGNTPGKKTTSCGIVSSGCLTPLWLLTDKGDAGSPPLRLATT